MGHHRPQCCHECKLLTLVVCVAIEIKVICAPALGLGRAGALAVASLQHNWLEPTLKRVDFCNRFDCIRPPEHLGPECAVA